jgi:amino acid adenylation domain-containing protein
MNEMNTLALESRVEESKDYWIRKLVLPTPSSGIRPDYARSGEYRFKEGSGEINIPREVFERLTRLTNTSQFLLYVTLLTVLKICLQKYTGENVVIIGSPSRLAAGKDVAANVLPIVTEIDNSLSFRELLLRVRNSLLEAYGKQDYPYERLIRDLKLDQINNRCPLFDVALVLTNIHAPLPEVKNDITLTFTLEDAALIGSVAFNSFLFAKQSVDQLIDHFLHLLKESLCGTSLHISQLNLLTAEAQELILTKWNNTKVSHRGDYCIHEKIEAESVKRPTAIALDCDGKNITYFELNSRANRLARYLRRMGVRSETLVGVFVERGVEMVVAILGILKAGGAYVPLDTSYPQRRLAYFVEDASLGIVVTQRPIVEKLPACGAERVYLDEQWNEISKCSDEAVDSDVGPNNLAYVIYTSGTTGKPKGVMIDHRGLCNLVEGQIRGFKIGPDSRVLQFASMSFDASVWEIFVSLVSGARLFIMSKERLLPGGELEDEIRGKQITTVTLPPSVLRLICKDGMECLKILIVAGEACGHDVLEEWGAGRTIINAYGPTEVTVCATLGQCRSDERRVSIGSPIQNTRAYILDQRQMLTPVNVVGELYVSGVGLARGYLGGQAQTAEKFLPDGYSGESGARMYRTGDLCRYMVNGQIEYIGRHDQQIKMRGYRVEPAEIEEVLNGHEEIKQSAVVVKLTKDGEKRMVAYVVPGREVEAPDNGSALRADKVRSLLRMYLPDYMIPAEIVMLKMLPLTTNGKLDRDKLIARVDDYEVRYSGQGPSTEAESLIEGVWQEILGCGKIGVDLNFFDLGGNSLQMVQVYGKLQSLLDRELSIIDFFEHPTIRSLASYLTGGAVDTQVTTQNVDRIIEKQREGNRRQSRQRELTRKIRLTRQGAPGDARLADYLASGRHRQGTEIELWPSVAEYFVYDEALYYAMTHDERRNDSYRLAINRAVNGKVALDIGTGPEALLARFCVEGGARRVYAIEMLEEPYRRALERVQSLGMQDQIVLIRGNVTMVELPEPVDVCVSEIIGPIGGVEGAAMILNDARRFLKPGGIMIPRQSTTLIAGVTLPAEFLAEPGFSYLANRYVSKIFDQVGRRFNLRLCLKGISPGALLTTCGVFEDLDFGGATSSSYQQELRLTVERDGLLDGFLAWLNLYTDEEAEVIDILKEEYCWLPVYLPVFEGGLEVKKGDQLTARIRGQLSENGVNPDYEVRGEVRLKEGKIEKFEYNSRQYGADGSGQWFYEKLFKKDNITPNYTEHI